MRPTRDRTARSRTLRHRRRFAYEEGHRKRGRGQLRELRHGAVRIYRLAGPQRHTGVVMVVDATQGVSLS